MTWLRCETAAGRSRSLRTVHRHFSVDCETLDNQAERGEQQLILSRSVAGTEASVGSSRCKLRDTFHAINASVVAERKLERVCDCEKSIRASFARLSFRCCAVTSRRLFSPTRDTSHVFGCGVPGQHLQWRWPDGRGANWRR